MQVRLNESGYVSGFAQIGHIENGITVTDPENIEHFRLHYRAYIVEDGVLSFDEAQDARNQNTAETEEIRLRRERECFPIINRGQLWYDRLTDEQRRKLAEWYQAWLDAPETRVIPDRLEWTE